MSEPGSPPTSDPPPALVKLLVALLQEAAEIEHQLMIQYLYAAFSLKKSPDGTCNDAQFESVRRWGSTLLMVARQEMEHLALVNGMLAAVGAKPWFDRQEIPAQFTYYLGAQLARGRDRSAGTAPCNIPFVFERYDLDTIERFVCFESPSKAVLEEYGFPVPEWCFSCADEPALLKAAAGEEPESTTYDLAGSRLDADLWSAAQAELAKSDTEAPLLKANLGTESIRPGTIQELYDLVERLFELLSARWNVFTGDPSRQVFVPVEYQINVFPITDLTTVKQALKLIVEEGEGIDSPPDYQSHFLRFFAMRNELVELLKKDPLFEPSLPLPLNPRREEITNDLARELFDLFDYTYVTLLFLLTSLYTNFVPSGSQSYPYFSSALQENAFGPMMTMLLRPLAEIMAYTRSGDGDHTTGPGYCLTDDDRRVLQGDAAELGNVELFLHRLAEITARLERLSTSGLAAVVREAPDVPFVQRQLAFVHESAQAMTNNMRRIYQIGQLPQFIVTP
jgi:hypothetical protein